MLRKFREKQFGIKNGIFLLIYDKKHHNIQITITLGKEIFNAFL